MAALADFRRALREAPPDWSPPALREVWRVVRERVTPRLTPVPVPADLARLGAGVADRAWAVALLAAVFDRNPGSGSAGPPGRRRPPPPTGSAGPLGRRPGTGRGR